MAGLTSVGGLVSGLSTPELIDSLMQVEGNRQTLLKTRLTTTEGTKTALQSLNARLASLADSAKALAGDTGWSTRRVVSSDSGVTASATTAALTGSVSFGVNQTALSQRLVFATTAAATDRVLPEAATTIRLTDSAGVSTIIDTGDGTMKGLVDAVNAAEVGVRASVVTLSDGTQRLSMTATATGAGSAFTVTDADGGQLLGGRHASSVDGRDASITIDGDVVTSASNTFSDVLDGVTFTLSPTVSTTEPVTLSVSTDTASIAGSVQKLVDEVNAVLSEISTRSTVDADGLGGLLTGNSAARAIRDQLLESVSRGVGGTSLSGVGVQVTSDGTLSFDRDAFITAYDADPAGTQDLFTRTTTVGTQSAPQGFAAVVRQVAELASNSTTGTLTASINGLTTTATSLTESIAAWDLRLENRRTTLERKFTAMETALSSLQNQATWLSGQISSLSSSGS